MTRRAVFFAATDTEAGRARLACAPLCAKRAVGVKSAAAKAEPRDGPARNEDIALLWAASNSQAPERRVNPYCFRFPIAPQIALEAGVEIRSETIVEAFDARPDRVVVDGARRLPVSLGANCSRGRQTCALALPLVAVGMRLGRLHRALLTRRATRELGLTLAIWVASCIDPELACRPQKSGAAARAEHLRRMPPRIRRSSWLDR